ICGISHHDAHACIDALREALALKGDQEDDATAKLCVAVNGPGSLPERYRDYSADERYHLAAYRGLGE
ncbi:hypothetical protein Q6329_27975, partial [Klebsiella pneumoniae]|nr:hypothetical protein [Klebsiella pneumoniae]